MSLAAALPSLPALETLWVKASPGLGSEGVAALVAAVPNCPRLRELYAFDSLLAEEDRAKLRVLNRWGGDPAGYLYVGV